MTTTISRLYNNYTDAQRAVRDLEAAGVPHSEISIVANNPDNWFSTGKKVDRDHDGVDDRAEGAGTGAGVGAGLGGAAGLLAGLEHFLEGDCDVDAGGFVDNEGRFPGEGFVGGLYAQTESAFCFEGKIESA